jgi:hypothetical protein
MTSILAAIGITTNMVGTLLMSRFGLPEPTSKAGNMLIEAAQTDPTQIQMARLFRRLASGGAALLVLDFLLQLIAVLAQPAAFYA